MMNPMNPGGLTDDELLRLARLLQQTRGEGLAFINPGEAQMLRDAGGSGEPIPGTQGFGVGGGPIRSYQPDEAETYSGEFTGSNEPEEKPDQGAFETRIDVIAKRKNQGGGGDSSDNIPIYTPPPKFFDKLGREYSSQADADLANQRIDTQRAQLETAFDTLTTDQEFDTLKLQEPDKFYFADLPEDEVRKKFDEKKILAFEESKLQTKNLSDDIGRAFQNLDQTALQNLTYDQISQGLGNYNRLSEDTQRNIFGSMLQTAVREARFTLTPEEVDAFARTAIQAAPVDDATAPTVGEVAPADQVAVGEVGAPDRVIVGEIGELNRDLIDKVVEGEDQLADYLLQRVRGEATSPAELQLKRATEQNLRSLLGATAGTADPAKLRQIRNIFAETSQVLSGQAAELRSREQIDAENRLVQLYKQQGDRELQVAMVNLETKKQEAFKQADLDQVRNLSIQQANLQRVITKANLDRDVELANLDTRRQRSLAQGRIDVAVALANLEKDITLSKLDAELALRSRALDDALALANYQGQMALEGIEVKIDLTELELDVKTKLAELGFETQEKLAQLNADTQLAIANLNSQAKKYAADSKERAATIGAIATIVSAFAT
tara:strand:+ start:1321 stop:3150 length:1830 start_codon:yes stop_codon:yes gene_type:complete